MSKTDRIKEEFLPVHGYSNYLVSNYGRVINAHTGRELKGAQDTYGYNKVCLVDAKGKRTSFFRHRLVAMVHIRGYREGWSVRIINGIKTDCRVENLSMTRKRVRVSEEVKKRLELMEILRNPRFLQA